MSRITLSHFTGRIRICFGFFSPTAAFIVFFPGEKQTEYRDGSGGREGDAGGLEFGCPWSFGIGSVVASFAFQSLIIVACLKKLHEESFHHKVS